VVHGQEEKQFTDINPTEEAMSRPVHEVKVGAVRAAVWMNEGSNGSWPSVTFSRLFKDKTTGQWQDSQSFSREDLPLLIKAADQVHTYLYRPGERAAEFELEEAANAK
jgi:hypothetical protein